MSTTYTAEAVRWEGGWELHVEGVGVTQVRTLDKAAQQVRDLVETMDDSVDASDAEVRIVYTDLPELDSEIREVRGATEAAAQAQVEAAERARALLAHMRDAGFSVTDASAALGVSRGRVSQLLAAIDPQLAGTRKAAETLRNDPGLRRVQEANMRVLKSEALKEARKFAKSGNVAESSRVGRELAAQTKLARETRVAAKARKKSTSDK